MGYAYLLKRLNTIWHHKSKMELITLEDNYCLVKFGSVMDYEFAKYGGPWMIMEHYLIVKDWMPNFDPQTNKIEKVIVWVRLPDLPMEYYDHNILFRVGEMIGTPMMINSAISLTTRGKFERLCVEVDITKPLLAKFWLRRKVRRIKYEGIHLVCFKCGIYGHSYESCNKKYKDDGQVGEQSPENAVGNAQGTDGDIHGNESMRKEDAMFRNELSEPFGPWMIAKHNTRKPNLTQGRREGIRSELERQKNNGHKTKTKDSGKGGSRYAALADERKRK